MGGWGSRPDREEGYHPSPPPSCFQPDPPEEHRHTLTLSLALTLAVTTAMTVATITSTAAVIRPMLKPMTMHKSNRTAWDGSSLHQTHFLVGKCA